ncbi:hypothetical protein BRADI_4g06536v3 [Brachypodium distachyon]|uniref:Uncharacterized protein n=1 Tax=Brachypodium distachyon TaxID=15368 RepID=A0A0Q3PBT8_BRADI|nr:hypothetical protein BRADI_4g06536v3 [Brachypodium distachyon]
MGQTQSPFMRLPEAEQLLGPVVATSSGNRNRKEQFGKSTKARNKYYKNSTKDDLVLRVTLESITRIG